MGTLDWSPPMHLFLLGLTTLFLSCRASVILTKDNRSLVFESADAIFAPKIPSVGICGIISIANPVNACAPLLNKTTTSVDHGHLRFVLVSRGLCSFETKVRHGQDAGYDAVIVTDNVENSQLLTMAGSKKGIKIPAVFVSKLAGEILADHASDSLVDCWILPSSYENIAWLVMIISFISLLGVIAAFAIYFLVQSGRRRNGSGSKACKGISYQAVKAFPTVIYKSVDNNTELNDTCAICLEDYVDGSNLRILPCNHRFHSLCIDAWLVNWRAFCPICKNNVLENSSRVSEHTPLLYPNGSQEQLSGMSGMTGNAPGHNVDHNSGSPHEREPHLHQYSRLNVPPIRIINAPRQISFQSRNSRRHPISDSVEAFRASPYFTPPSFFHNSAPNALNTLDEASPGNSQHGATTARALCGSPDNSSHHLV